MARKWGFLFGPYRDSNSSLSPGSVSPSYSTSPASDMDTTSSYDAKREYCNSLGEEILAKSPTVFEDSNEPTDHKAKIPSTAETYDQFLDKLSKAAALLATINRHR
jgi:hypothetical protein